LSAGLAVNFAVNLLSATVGGSCAHPDRSRGLALLHNDASDFWVGASTPILPYFCEVVLAVSVAEG